MPTFIARTGLALAASLAVMLLDATAVAEVKGAERPAATTQGSAPARPVEVHIDRRANVGEHFPFSCAVTATAESERTAQGSPSRKTKAVQELLLDGQVEVLGVDAKGREQKISCVVTRCTCAQGDVKRDLVPAGSTLVVTKQNAEVTLDLKPGRLDADAAKLLTGLFWLDDARAPTDGEIFGTADVRHIAGDRWPVDTKALADYQRLDGINVDRSNVSGTARLAELTTIDGVGCAKIVMEFTSKHATGLAPGGLPADIEGTWARVLPVDPSRRALARSLRQTTKFSKSGTDQAGKPVVVHVTITTDAEMSFGPSPTAGSR
jgi:hypothetical protein